MHSLTMVSFAQRMSSVHRSFIREILKVTEDPQVISFAGGLPNPSFFPVRELAAAAQKVLEEGGESALQYSTTEGYPPLRALIAKRYTRAGVKVGPEDILIVNGSQQALDLMGKVFLDKGDTVLMERPTYLAAIQAFGIFEPRFCALSLEEDGVSIGELEAALARTSAKLFYTIPNFQNPSGISYSEEKRRQAAEAMRGSSTILVEDDPYGELRFIGKDLPPIRSLMDDHPAVLLGTFSKIVSPGLRIGWVCAGREIMERLVIAKQASDLHSNGLAQRIVHRYMSDNDVEAHIARIRAGLSRAARPHGGPGRPSLPARGELHETRGRHVSLDDAPRGHVGAHPVRARHGAEGGLCPGPGLLRRRRRGEYAAAELLQLQPRGDPGRDGKTRAGVRRHALKGPPSRRSYLLSPVGNLHYLCQGKGPDRGGEGCSSIT